jgi:hypothetical protein
MAGSVVKLVVAAELGESIRELRKVRSELGGIEKTAGDTSRKTHEHLSKIGTGATIALGGLAAGLGMATKAALDAQVSQAKLALSVKNAGISWKGHREEIEKNLTAARKLSGFTDADLETSMAKLITTTGGVGKALKLQREAMDLSRARGIPLQQSTVLLSKVWQGNTTSLTRLGISLGKHATRQQALAALQDKFGRSAKKYGETAAGAIARQTAAFDALEVNIGNVMLPVVTKLSDYLTRLINEFNGLSGKTQRWIKYAGGATVAVLAGLAAFVKITQAIKATREAMAVLNATMLLNPAVAITAGIVALGVALVIAYKKSRTFRDVVNGAFNDVKRIASDVIGFVRDHWKALLVGMTGGVGIAVVEIVQHWQGIKKGISSIVSAIRGIWNTAKSDATGAWRSIVNTVDGFINHIIDAYDWVAGKIGLSKIPDLPTFGGGGGGHGGSSPGGPGGGRRGTHGAQGIVKPSGSAGSLIAGEAGHPEAVLSMNPAHAERTFQLMGQVAQHLASARRMALGGITGAIGGAVNAVKGAAGSALGFLNPLSHLPHMPTFSGPLADFGSAMVHKIYNAAKSKLLSLVGGLFGGGGGGGSMPTGTGASGANQALGLQMMLAAGWPRSQWGALQALWTRESGWNQFALNASSGAYGIPQSLPASKMASAGADWRTNPATQIRWGLGYIRGRYGSPAAAWAHETAIGWYDRGGWVGGPTGAPQPAVVHGGELVLTPKQQRQLGNHYHLHITVNGADLSDAATQRRVASRLGNAIINDISQQAGR